MTTTQTKVKHTSIRGSLADLAVELHEEFPALTLNEANQYIDAQYEIAKTNLKIYHISIENLTTDDVFGRAASTGIRDIVRKKILADYPQYRIFTMEFDASGHQYN